MGELALEEGRIRAAPSRFGDRHSGSNPESTRAIGSRLHHAALIASPAHDQQLDLAQLRMALAADLHKERVEIEVQEASGHP